MSRLVEFVDELPRPRYGAPDKWKTVRDTLAGNAGVWARIEAKGGYPRQRLKDLGCEVCQVKGVTYARWAAVRQEER
jgi:hypothetical protein